ncbi:MAG TPA: hypothetical protein VH008_29330 [Pseudonocardia sp.]|nr:hypothetical protein [Pseudonocardia sp.]
MTEPGTRPDQTGPEHTGPERTDASRDAEARELTRMRRTSWLWVAASVVGVLGGVANYLLATRVVSASDGLEPEIGAAALVAALLGLACWLLLALLWVTLQVPLRNDRGWARVALGVSSALGFGLDAIALAGSWVTITAAVLQCVLLVAALWQTFRPTPS